MTWKVNGRPLHSILVTRLRYLGDVVMSTVVLEVLREGDPDLRLGYLCESGHAAAVLDHPLLDRVHVLGVRRKGNDARARRSSQTSGPIAAGFLGTVADLQDSGYDLAVDLFFNPRSAWLLKLAGIPQRIGGTRSSRRHLYTHSILRREMAERNPGFDALAPGGLGEHLSRLEPLVHQETGLSFARWLEGRYQPGQLRPRIAVASPGPDVDGILSGLDLPHDHPLLVLAPGATWPSKEWPLGHWQELIAGLLAARSESILVLPPPGNADTWNSLAASIPSGRGGVLPVLDLPRVLDLISRAALLISVDGGIMHSGVGLGVPTVGLFGPTRTDAWFPYEGSGPYRVLCTRPACHPCDLHECNEFICLPDLKPEQVLLAAGEVTGG